MKIKSHLSLLIFSSILYSLGDVLLKITNFDRLFSFSRLADLIVLVTLFSALFLTFVAKLLIGKVLAQWELGYTQALFIAISIVVTSTLGILIFEEIINYRKILGYIFLIVGTIITINKNDNPDPTT